MRNYIDHFKIFAGLHGFLENNGIKFTKEGYPVFRPEFILQETPQEILPFSHRNACKEKTKTAVCFFENDKFLYRRIVRLNQDLLVYKEYLGICGFDLSPRIGWLSVRAGRAGMLAGESHGTGKVYVSIRNIFCETKSVVHLWKIQI